MSRSINTLIAIRLLILGSSRDQAEIIEASLRNGGLAVHCTQVFEMNALEDTLRSQNFELLLCCAFDKNIDIFRTLDILAEEERDLPVLILFAKIKPFETSKTDQTDKTLSNDHPTEITQPETETLLQALRSGARDLIDKNDLELLQLTIAREIRDLQQRRELVALKKQLIASEQRCLALIEGSREAIAFFQDGMHVQANPAYLQLFGFDEPDDIEALPLLDVINKNDRNALRSALKSLDAQSEHHVFTLDINGQHQDGSTLPISLSIRKVELEGEPSLQINIRSDIESTSVISQTIAPLSATAKSTDTSIDEDSAGISLLEDQILQELQSVSGNLEQPASAASLAPTVSSIASTTILQPTASKLDDINDQLLQFIDTGLSNNQFSLLYQSIVNLHGGGTREHYTITAQLVDEQDKRLSWDEILVIANKYNRMNQIDRWIINQSIKTLKEYRDKDFRVNFFIPLSEASILDLSLLQWILDCLIQHDARGNWLIFQIKEKYARNNLQEAIRLIEGLQKIKCQIALDEFGLLPNPDSFLNQIDVNYAKLAYKFSQNLNIDQKQQDTLSKINELLLRHKIRSIVSMSEDSNALYIIWSLGIACIQGPFAQEPFLDIEI